MMIVVAVGACGDLPVGVPVAAEDVDIAVRCGTGDVPCTMSVGQVDTLEATVMVAGAGFTGIDVSWIPLDSSALSIRRMDQVLHPDSMGSLSRREVLGLSLRAEVVALARGEHTVRFVVEPAGLFADAEQPEVTFRISVEERWGTVAAGGGHTCALTFRDSLDTHAPYATSIREGGEAFCWGDGPDGALGSGSFGADSPLAILTDERFLSISAGHGHTCAVDANRLVACWGGNERGELGTGNTLDQFHPVELALGIPFGVLSLGHQFSCGTPKSGGTDSALISTACWGRNVEGQLGCDVGDPGDGCAATSLEDKGDLLLPSEDVKSTGDDIFFSVVDAGARHACGIEAVTGLAWCWGDNSFGQLGVAASPTCNKAGGAPNDTTYFPCSRLAVPVQGPGGGQPLVFEAISAGDGFTCARAMNEVYCWGRNDQGQLGDGSTADSHQPVRVAGGLGSGGVTGLTSGGAHSCVLSRGVGAYCWGSNRWGQLGDGSTTTSGAPVRVVGDLDFVRLSAGADHTCGVVDRPAAGLEPGGPLYCWGSNDALEPGGMRGKLGSGTLEDSREPVRVVEPRSGS